MVLIYISLIINENIFWCPTRLHYVCARVRVCVCERERQRTAFLYSFPIFPSGLYEIL